jgi:hypothetical protein
VFCLLQLGEWEERSGNRVCLGYAALLVLWMAVSVGLNAVERGGPVFGLTAVILSKVLFCVIVVVGRLYLFPHYRVECGMGLLFALLVLILCGAGIPRIGNAFSWYYRLLVLADTVVWAFYLTLLVEVLYALGVHWSRVRPENYRELNILGLWRCFWTDLLYLGIWITLLLGLAFYYLVNFYVMDVIFYSRLLAGILAGCGLFFFAAARSRVNGWFREEIGLLDQKIGAFLDWPNVDARIAATDLPVYRYLLLTREYFKCLQRTTIFPGALLFYLLCVVLLLSLPLWAGTVIKV